MKSTKNLVGKIFLISLIAAAGFTSCMDKDHVAPVVVLIGNETLYVTLNDKYVEQGIQVYDNRDANEDLAIVITNNIDTAEEDFITTQVGSDFVGIGATVEVGEYQVTYKVTDSEGNSTTKIRTIIVENELAKYARLYIVTKHNVTLPSLSYPDYELEIEVDENINNRIWFPRFSNLQFYNLRVYANIVGNDLYIPLQSFPEDNNYVIEGFNASNGGLAGYLDRNDFVLYIKYLASNNTEGTQTYEETFVKY